jgi:hypothetical protein
MAVAHQTSAAIIGYLVGMSLEQSRYLGFDRLCEKRARTITQHLAQRIGKSSWLGELENVSVGHGVSSFDGEWRLAIPPRYATSSLHAVTNFQV